VRSCAGITRIWPAARRAHINFSLGCINTFNPLWPDLDIAKGSALGEAIGLSGILMRYSDIDPRMDKTASSHAGPTFVNAIHND
tara:strand:- start:1278 stop:1529 length:252 start_codon:yes stop_codon:yes gene_type:complete